MEKLSLIIALFLAATTIAQDTKSTSRPNQPAVHSHQVRGDACPKRISPSVCEVDVDWLAQQETTYDSNTEHDPIVVAPELGLIIFKAEPGKARFRVKSYIEIGCRVPYAPVSGSTLQPFKSSPYTDFRMRHPTDLADENASTHCFKATIERQNGTTGDPHIYVSGHRR